MDCNTRVNIANRRRPYNGKSHFLNTRTVPICVHPASGRLPGQFVHVCPANLADSEGWIAMKRKHLSDMAGHGRLQRLSSEPSELTWDRHSPCR